MIRILTTLFVFLCLTAFVQAMPAPLKQGEILRGSFVQNRYMVGFDKPLKSEGSFVVVAGKGVLWRVTKPFNVTTIITAKGLIQTSNSKRIMNLSVRQVPFIKQIYQMIGGVLAGQWDVIEKEFIVERDKEKSPWHIQLTPQKTKQAFMPFQKVSVTGNAFVNEVIMTKKDGGRDVMSFTKVVVSRKSLSEAEMLFFEMSMP